MNNPYPSAVTLAAEDRVNILLIEQRTATDRIREILTRAADEIEAVDCPLGEPMRHFDLTEMLGAMRHDFTEAKTDADLCLTAWEKAREWAEQRAEREAV